MHSDGRIVGGLRIGEEGTQRNHWERDGIESPTEKYQDSSG